MGWQHYDNSQPNEMTMLVHVLTFDRSDGYLKRVLHGRGVCLLEIHNHLCPADLHCGRGLWVIVTSVYILKKKPHDWYQILWQGKLTVVWEEFCIQFFILAVSYTHYQCFVNWLLSTLGTYVSSGIQSEGDGTGSKVDDADADLQVVLVLGQNGDLTLVTDWLRADRPPGLDDNYLIQADRLGRKKAIIFQLICDRNNSNGRQRWSENKYDHCDLSHTKTIH